MSKLVVQWYIAKFSHQLNPIEVLAGKILTVLDLDAGDLMKVVDVA